MELRTLPLDGIRPILAKLNLASLVKLFLTMDKSIQRLLSASGALTSLRISFTPGVSRFALLYFLRSVRNVKQLSFDIDIQWLPASLSLLASMNPSEVVLSKGLIQLKAADTMKAHLLAPQNPKLKQEAMNLTHILLPDFSLLVPSLQSVQLTCMTSALTKNYKWGDYAWKLATQPNWSPQSFYSFPPSLTALDHMFVFPKEIEPLLEVLPPTLRSLKLSAVDSIQFDFHSVFTKFSELEEICVRPVNAIERATTSSEMVEAPKWLNHFDFGMTDSCAASLLESCNFLNSHLTRVRFQLTSALGESVLHLGELLPSSVTDMTVGIIPTLAEGHSCCSIASFPLGLERLTLSLCRSDERLPLALQSLVKLKALTIGATNNGKMFVGAGEDELSDMMRNSSMLTQSADTIHDRGRLNLIIYAHRLPRSLTHLDLYNENSLSESVISSLPVGLLSATFHRCDSALQPRFFERARNLKHLHLGYTY